MKLDPSKPIKRQDIQDALDRGETIEIPPGNYKISSDPWERLPDKADDEYRPATAPLLLILVGVAVIGTLVIGATLMVINAYLSLP